MISNVRVRYLLLCVIVLSSLQALYFASEFGVNVLFSDQWDFLDPLFHGAGAFSLFDLRHGPHRQGVGGVVTGFLFSLTRWNVLAESYFIVLLMIASSAIFLEVKRRFSGSLGLADVFIPFVCLSLDQVSGMLVVPNNAHSAFPFFMVSLVALSLSLGRGMKYAVIMGLLGGSLIFTGFGIFAAPPLAFLLVWETACSLRSDDRKQAVWPLAALAAMVIAGVWFISDWVFDPAIADFHVVPSLYSYAAFAMRMVGTGILNKHIPVWGELVGALFLLAGLWIMIWSLYGLLRKDKQFHYSVLFFLSSFSLLFIAATSFGRLPLGSYAADASRYRLLMTPLCIALYLSLHQVSHYKTIVSKVMICAVFFAGIRFAALSFPMIPITLPEALYYAHGKREWAEAYLATGSIAETSKMTDFKIHPDVQEWKIQYLKENNLNFFTDGDVQ